jgi:subtilisin-like proprotein convertase family protein
MIIKVEKYLITFSRMKGMKLLSLLLSLCLSLTAMATVTVTKDSAYTNYLFTIDGTSTEVKNLNNQQFDQVSLTGIDGYHGINYQVGYPQTPAINFYVHASSPEDIAIRFSQNKSASETKHLKNELIPSQPSRPKIKGATTPFVKHYNYKSAGNALWPTSDHSIKYIGSENGQKKFLVSLYPLRYSINKRDFTLNKQVEVTVKNSNAKSIENESKKDVFVFIIGQQFIESDSLKNYIELKRQMGYHPITIAVGQEINTPEEIRAALKEIYFNQEYNLMYALIVGDADDVPGQRPSFITTGVTDHYYRAIDTEVYEEDINAPDIGVGRISVSSEELLRPILEKYTKYQKGDFAESAWLNSVSFLATDDRWELAEGTHNHAIDNYFAPGEYTGVFPENPMVGGDRLYAVTHRVANQTVFDTMNLGRAIINYSGHGAHTFWDAPGVTQENVRALDHNSALPFVISNACITGDFTKSESFAETWQRHPQGAVLFWGSMDNTYWDEDDILEKAMYRGIFENGYRHFNMITQYALKEHYRHYAGENRSNYYWETYIPFGDPSVRLRLKNPATITLDGPRTLPMGAEEVIYTVTDSNGAPLSGAKVALSSAEITTTGLSDQNGVVTLDITGAIVGTEFNITIYANDTVLKNDQLKIIASNVPYLLFDQVTNHGAQLAEVASGERVSLNFVVKNAATVATDGATLKLTLLSGPVEILADTLNIEPLASNETLHYEGERLSFKVGSGSDMEPITLALEWETKEGTSGKKMFNLNLVKGVLALTQIDFGNPDSPEVGGIGAGEEGAIYLSFKNVGHEAITDAQIELLLGTCLESISVPTIMIDRLNPGQNFRLASPLQASVSQTCKIKDKASLTARGRYSNPFTSIEINGENSFRVGRYGQSIFSQSSIGQQIEDQGTTFFDFTIDQEIKSIEDVTVALNITHTYIGDLTITLISPAGNAATLHSKEGASDDDIDQVYTIKTTENLKRLIGDSALGTWRLRMRDNAANDVGVLNQLSVELKGYL